jgi:hypothetical protein
MALGDVDSEKCEKQDSSIHTPLGGADGLAVA